MKIVLLGPPLSGKGTQGQLLSERSHFPRLSVGALIRKLYREERPEGILASKFMLQGEAIPGNLLIKIISPWLKAHSKKFIIDNLIRTDDQLKAFSAYSRSENLKIDKVIHLTLPEKEINRRLTERISEHLRSNRLRPDENINALAVRIKVYNSFIKKILNYFKIHSTIYTVSGDHSVAKVYEIIINKLGLKKDDYS